jgi:hypothetical protein
METKTMTKDELRLLLYLETQAVDHGGMVDARRMNAEDVKIAKQWTKAGFIDFGRIASDYCTETMTFWVCLSSEAWQAAHEGRKAKAARMWLARTWKTTDEKRDLRNGG